MQQCKTATFPHPLTLLQGISLICGVRKPAMRESWATLQCKSLEDQFSHSNTIHQCEHGQIDTRTVMLQQHILCYAHVANASHGKNQCTAQSSDKSYNFLHNKAYKK